MALVKCPECGNEISDKANFCVHCNCQLNKQKKKDVKICPECNGNIDKDSKMCPNCGYSFLQTKRKYKPIVFGVVIAICIVVVVISLIYYFKIYEGEFCLEQNQTTIELGRNEDLLKLLKYDDENIIDVELSDDGGYDYNKLGEYTVVFTATNERKNRKEFTFVFEVVDTIAPTIEIPENEIYIAKGTEFVIENYVKAQDKSNNCIISYSGEMDTNKEGKYSIKAYAKDLSGNISEEKELSINIENRDDCDFKMAKFGDSKEIVKRYETEELIEQEEVEGLLYSTTLMGINARLMYVFNDEDQLCRVGYIFDENHTDYNLYFSDYEIIKEALVEKYGDPDDKRESKGSLYGYCDTKGEALSLGQYGICEKWNLDNKDICIYLFSDNYVIEFVLVYESKEYTKTNNTFEY